MHIDTGNVTISSIAVGSMDNNVYFLRNRGGDYVVVDAAAEPDAIMVHCADGRICQVITTHRHADHIGALAAVIEQCGCSAWSGAADADAISAATGVPQQILCEGDRVRQGDIEADVIELVGHTPGGIALILRPGSSQGYPSGAPIVITGDSLFPGGVGKTTNPEDFTTLLSQVEEKIFAALPDETLILPGHGKPTTLGAERGSIAQWWQRGW